MSVGGFLVIVGEGSRKGFEEFVKGMYIYIWEGWNYLNCVGMTDWNFFYKSWTRQDLYLGTILISVTIIIETDF